MAVVCRKWRQSGKAWWISRFPFQNVGACNGVALLIDWWPAAVEDLLTIQTYNAEVNLQAATDLQIRVDRALRHLGANPYNHKLSDRVEGVCEIVISANYFLLFQVTNKIEVLTDCACSPKACIGPHNCLIDGMLIV